MRVEQVARCLPNGQILAFRESLLKAWKHERLQSEPSAFPSGSKQPGVQMSKYTHRMGLCVEGAAPLTMQEHSRAFIPVEHHKALMRFRLCCWPLTSNRAYGRPREERTCSLCVANEIEDENRVLMQCTAYDQLRAGSEIDFAGGWDAGGYAEYGPSQVSHVTRFQYSLWEHRS